VYARAAHPLFEQMQFCRTWNRDAWSRSYRSL